MNFSILISTYNQSEYLLRCINSCINQNYKRTFEVIICDTSLESNFHVVEHIKKKKLNIFIRRNFLTIQLLINF